MERLIGATEPSRSASTAELLSGSVSAQFEPSGRQPHLRTADLWVLVLPTTLFLVHAIAFGGWLVDDAGISLAYARNLASGYGLVSQSGMRPVEGYSNPLWVFLLCLGFLAKLSPLVLSKLLAIAVIELTFVACLLVLRDRLPNGRFIVVLSLCLASVQTSIVVWSVSGLENSLTLLLTTLLIATLVCENISSMQIASFAGCLVTALALTRPEGLIYGWLYPVAALRSFDRRGRRAVLVYLGVIVATALPYLLIRILYFEDILPNSYYAKGGPGGDTVMELLLLQSAMRNRVLDVLRDLTGYRSALWVLIGVLGSTFCALSKKTWTWIHSVLSFVTLTDLAGFLLLPSDWMPAHRYATAFFFDATLFAVVLLFGGTFLGISRASWPRKEALGIALVLSLALINVPRTLTFRRDPTISVQEVADRATRLETIAGVLQVKAPSWLTPDVGGALLYSRMRIFDLGMLCDERIARYLGEGAPSRNVEAFHDYVFDELQPTFISIRAYHSWIARFPEDPRFRRDYIPLHEFADDWIRERFGKTILSGEYVRRSLLHSDGPSIQAIRREWTAHPMHWDR